MSRLIHLEHNEPYDFSCDLLVAPDGLDIWAALAERDAWYRDEYMPALRRGDRPQYFSPAAWLIARHGCRQPTDEIECIDAEERP